MEKKLTNQMDYSKNLESKLSSTKKELHIAETQNTEMQKTLNSSKAASELTNSELQKKLKTLQREKEEAVKHETASAKVMTKNHTYINVNFARSISRISRILPEHRGFVREHSNEARGRNVSLDEQLRNTFAGIEKDRRWFKGYQ